ncbi:c-type cytochrome biogenesis protein CcmI [Cupriavidus taiwanensis]|uniref:c-type cytochrome biogenesis protein CcmI n=1 Tax=Cupriavidus taiwanensis TaxID=164546 RepID=UPI000E10688A
MTTFWLLAAALIGAATLCLLWPLLRRGAPSDSATPARALLVDLYHDQLRELDRDLHAGTLGAARHAEARAELGRRLLDEAAGSATAPASARPAPLLAALLLAALPSAAILLYLHLGNPVALWRADDLPAASGSEHQLSGAQVEGMVNQLAQRLREAPGDAQGWAMLARSYSVLERHADAAAAYARAVELAPDVAALRSDYADALATLGGGVLDDAPMAQVRQALALDPTIPRAWRSPPAPRRRAATKRRRSATGNTCTGCCRRTRRPRRASPPTSRPRAARPPRRRPRPSAAW